MPDIEPVRTARLARTPPAELATRLDFPELVARLEAVRGAAEAAEADVHRLYEATCAAARHTVAKADEAVTAAQAQVTAAREQVRRTDEGAVQVWRALATRLTPRAALRLGPVPAPDDDPDLPVQPPLRLIALARARLDAVEPVHTLAVWAYLLMMAVAAGCAAGLALLSLGFRPFPLQVALLVLAPLLGLLPARLISRMQHARLDPAALILTLAAGAVTTAVLLLTE